MPRPEDRAASEVVGAVILFGFLVISFSIYQGVVVPNQNRGIEFDHNQAVQDSIQDLRNAIRQTATTGAEESVSIKLGASYPQRVIAVNPGASSGTIRTTSLGGITIQNVSGTDPEVSEYFGPTSPRLGPFESKAIVYEPVYFQYTQAPDTHYENTLAYNQFPNGVNLSITDQAIIDDRQITLIALNGSLSAARQGAVSIDTSALSTATNTVSVVNETGPINITFGTSLTAANWTELLEGEMTPDGHITAVTQTGPNQVSILLEPGVTYDLRIARVGVGDTTTAVEPKYIVDVEGDNTSVAEGGTQKLVVEARDRFNNPISNVTVSASSPAQGSLDTTSGTTDSSGRTTFVYSAPSDVNGAQDVDIDVSFDGGVTDNETVTFDVRVLDADGSGSGGGGGGGTGDGSGTDSAGAGQYTDFSEEQNQTVSTSGGVWDGVTSLERILMEELYIRDGNDNPYEGQTVTLVLNFEVRNKSSSDAYSFEIRLRYDWSSNVWSTNEVTIEEPGGNRIMQDEPLSESSLDSIFLLLDGSGELDLIGNDDYQGSPWTIAQENDFEDFAGEDTYIFFDQVSGGSVKISVE